MKIPLFLATLVALLSFTTAYAEERIWTSADGRELKAELMAYSLEAKTVTIKNSRGEYTLPS